MIADIARTRIFAVDDHPIIRSALGNEPEFHASLRPLGATQTTTPRRFFLHKRRMRVQARRPGNQNGNLG
jgi:hypothetical protein